MSENIENLIKEIDDIKAELEESRIKCEFDKADRLGFSLRAAKDKLVDAVREEYKMIRKQGYEYRQCVGCGNTWNVCKQKHNGRYVCPHCVERRRNDEKAKKA